MPRKKKLTPEQQAASEKIGKILADKESPICEWEIVDKQLRCKHCYLYANGLDAKGTRVCKLKAGIPPTIEESAQALRAYASKRICDTIKRIEEWDEQTTKEESKSGGAANSEMRGVCDENETRKECNPGITERIGSGLSGAVSKPCDEKKEAMEDHHADRLQSWQLGLCERVAQGDSIGAILSDYAISNAKFIQERDSNPEFKRKLDEAFGVVAEMVEYSMMNLALTGNATERKTYAPILLDKYGKKDERVNDDDKPEGETEGL